MSRQADSRRVRRRIEPRRAAGAALAAAALIAGAVALGPRLAAACPFCSAEQSTLTEELADSQIAVLAKLIEPAPTMEEDQEVIDIDSGKATFEVVDVLFGGDHLGGEKQVRAIYFGEPDKEALYLIRGTEAPVEWRIPLKLSDAAVEYVKRLRSLPESGADRIAFFQDYLQHEDPMLAQDAYDEFARAPYGDLKDLKDRMNRDQLLDWIEDTTVSPSRRRLYFTMLGVCGTQADLPRLEAMMLSDSRLLMPAAEYLYAASLSLGGPLAGAVSVESVRLEERRRKLGLDAMIACYLTLAGEEGMDLIDRRFLSSEKVAGRAADYSHVYAALMALRFLAEEENIVSVDRVTQSARLLLDHRDFADQVIPDLSRWEDWSVMDRLTDMYRQAGLEDSDVQKYVREPIITYLDVAAEQPGEVGEEAKVALESVEAIDPDAVRRARSLRQFGVFANATRSRQPDTSASPDAEGIAGIAEEGFETEEVQSDSPPDPSMFGGDPAAKTTNAAQPSQEDEAEDDLQMAEPLFPEDEQAGQADVATGDSASEPATSAPGVSHAAAAAVADAKPPKPPSQAVLILAPILAGAACFGLFWMILRGGSA